MKAIYAQYGEYCFQKRINNLQKPVQPYPTMPQMPPMPVMQTASKLLPKPKMVPNRVEVLPEPKKQVIQKPVEDDRKKEVA